MKSYCTICGAVITAPQSIATGMGGECRALVEAAVEIAVRQRLNNSPRKFEVWNVEVNLWKREYIKRMKGKKLREGSFHKNFLSSIRTAEKVSRKQLSVMQKRLEYEWGCNREAENFYDFVENRKKETYRKLYNEFRKDIKIAPIVERLRREKG